MLEHSTEITPNLSGLFKYESMKTDENTVLERKFPKHIHSKAQR